MAEVGFEPTPPSGAFDHDCGFTYSLKAQVHSIAASSLAKQYFYNCITFHDRLSIHSSQVSNRHCSNMQCPVPQYAKLTSARCRTQKWSPYHSYPYGISKPLEPEGQVDLVCESKTMESPILLVPLMVPRSEGTESNWNRQHQNLFSSTLRQQSTQPQLSQSTGQTADPWATSHNSRSNARNLPEKTWTWRRFLLFIDAEKI